MDGRTSKLKLALSAASLFLFLVGLKRTFRTEDGRYIDAGRGNARFRPDTPTDHLRNAS